ARCQECCERESEVPIYRGDWPLANSPRASEMLRTACAAGKAEIGVQLHQWVNPPFDEVVSERNSFTGNLPPELERAKLGNLYRAIERNFEVAPAIYRAGRYGVGPHTAEALAAQGIAIDTSVRANFDYSAGGGPDFRNHPLAPYWLDDDK